MIRSCIIRPDNNGDWSLLDDGTHSPQGIASVEQDDNKFRLKVNYDQAVTGKVQTFYAVPDDKLAPVVSCGVSAGLFYSYIYLAPIQTVTGKVHRGSSGWTTQIFRSSGFQMEGAWNDILNRFEITIPPWSDPHALQVSPLGDFLAFGDWSPSGVVRVKFMSYDGNVISQEQDKMGFTFAVPPMIGGVRPRELTYERFPGANINFELRTDEP